MDFTGTAGTRILTGVSAGALSANSSDAVNGGQLLTANQRVAAAFGGGAGLDANGQLTAPSYAILGNTYDNVGSALGALNTQVTSNTTSIDNLQTQVSNGSIGLVQQNATTRVISVGGSTDGAVVNVSGSAGNRTVTGVAAGALSATSTDAVNGSQLYATNLQVASLSGQVASNTTDIATLNATVTGISQASKYTRVNSSGPGANASGSEAIAIGSNAQATQSGSLAIGFNAARPASTRSRSVPAPSPPARSPSAPARPLPMAAPRSAMAQPPQAAIPPRLAPTPRPPPPIPSRSDRARPTLSPTRFRLAPPATSGG